MKSQILTIAVLALSTISTCAETPSSNSSIQFKFELEGRPHSCRNLKVQLMLGERSFAPPITGDTFVVPAPILQAYASKRLRYKANLTAKISCDDYVVTFPGLYPVRALPGGWTVGISYPTSWFDGPTQAPEAGTWVSYLVTECNECDPGVVTEQTHNNVPQPVLDDLREEQPTADGQRARDIAYALAVFRFNYDGNREFLVKQLRSCLARPKNSPEDDVCDRRLVDYLANLYWRGDSRLLQILLNIAGRREDVLDETGEFYAVLLDRRMNAVMGGLHNLPEEKQRLVCQMAFTDDLRFDSPKLSRITEKLRASTQNEAAQCLRGISEIAAQSR